MPEWGPCIGGWHRFTTVLHNGRPTGVRLTVTRYRASPPATNWVYVGRFDGKEIVETRSIRALKTRRLLDEYAAAYGIDKVST